MWLCRHGFERIHGPGRWSWEPRIVKGLERYQLLSVKDDGGGCSSNAKQLLRRRRPQEQP